MYLRVTDIYICAKICIFNILVGEKSEIIKFLPIILKTGTPFLKSETS